ncbi:2-C-methyl-D-erythritol 4-phosphate cytidylyltransferase [Actinomyces massiliensis]|uniref:IspD/TarI family cytidylyltransferase n=1 Tax=Actinomyces massiliensis TaxID=461393 RepID=UPI0028E589D5|nr:2-C-methyl-D-erythritol 4-phosphate cytidylyltransferase [Actinomyces massiliensis]
MPEPGRADGASGTAGAFSGRTGDAGDADDVAQGGPGSPGGKDAQGSQDGGVVAVLTAAGSGTRLGASGPKALVEIAGESLVRRAARGLLSAGVVRHVVVTAPAEYLDRFEAEVAGITEVAGLDGPGVSGTIEVVPGSPDSRQASVALGLAAALAAHPDAAVVLVHDAARALTPPEVVRRVVAAVRAGHDAVVPALPVTDTVKEVAGPDRSRSHRSESGHHETGLYHSTSNLDRSGAQRGRGAGVQIESVVGTPDRSRLRAVQTPQGFAAAALVAAHRLGADRAADEARSASDDAGLIEAAGGGVVVVEGDPLAMKVTTPVDLALADVLAAARQLP